MTDPVLATAPRSNAELVVACRDLGYLLAEDLVWDPTWGLGRWWTLWRPDRLEASDIDPTKSPIGRSIDFTDSTWPDAHFDVVTLDPPYKLNGTGGSHPSDTGYGVATTGVSWQARHELITQGISEAARVTRPGGRLLLKCQDQVCSGKVRWQTRLFADHAEAVGYELIDRLDVVSYRPQPPGRRQVHARRNTSTLLVLRRR